MLDDKVRQEMIFYTTTDDYSDLQRYERFALSCNLDKKGLEIGGLVGWLADGMSTGAQPINILETASATGLTAEGVQFELGRAGIDSLYTSLDIEPNLLCYAKQRKRGDNFIQGDFENLPFANNSFDIYIMMGAEGYRPNGKFYPEVYRVLKSGGYYVMPQIGAVPIVRAPEINAAIRSGLSIKRADDYLITRKP